MSQSVSCLPCSCSSVEHLGSLRLFVRTGSIISQNVIVVMALEDITSQQASRLLSTCPILSEVVTFMFDLYASCLIISSKFSPCQQESLPIP